MQATPPRLIARCLSLPTGTGLRMREICSRAILATGKAPVVFMASIAFMINRVSTSLGNAGTAAVTSLILMCVFSPNPALAQSVRFAAIGDLPYNTADERNVEDVLQDIAKSQSEFIIHLGDIKSGSEYCGNELLERRIRQLDGSAKPLIYTVGDNEWTDCHRRTAGGFDPLERLQWLRKRAFQKPVSLGQTSLAVQQQASLTDAADTPAENLRWQRGSVLFISFNVPGSNNNYWAQQEADHPRNAEFAMRRAHNEAWLSESISKARSGNIKAVVLAFQGNPFERDSAEQKSHLRDGFAEWRSQLALQLKSLGKPALLLHGDTHTHRIDQSLRDDKGQIVTNVLRLETFGFPFTRNWVEVNVDTSKAQLHEVFDIRVKRLLLLDEDSRP